MITSQTFTFSDALSSQFINVKSSPFNAQGDGVTNDTVAFQAAVDSVGALGGTIYVPPGTYVIGSININFPCVFYFDNVTVNMAPNQVNALFETISTFSADINYLILTGNLSVNANGNSVILDAQQISAGTNPTLVVNGKFSFSGFTQFAVRIFGAHAPTYVDIQGLTCIGATTPGSNPNSGIYLSSSAVSVVRIKNCNFLSCGNFSATYPALAIGAAGAGPATAYVENVYNNGHATVQFANVTQGFITDLETITSDTGSDGLDIINSTNVIIKGVHSHGNPSNGIAIGNVQIGQTTNNIILIGCIVHTNGGAGIALGQHFGTETNLYAYGNTCFSNGTAVPGNPADAAGIEINSDSVSVIGNTCYDPLAGSGTQTYGIAEKNTTAASKNLYASNNIQGNKTGPVLLVAAATGKTILRGNAGYNPVGKFTSQPAVPATTVALVNPFGVDCNVYVVPGASTCAVAVGGNATGVTLASSGVGGNFFVGAGQSITLTYTSAPTFIWFGA